jgi:hypothetical protein
MSPVFTSTTHESRSLPFVFLVRPPDHVLDQPRDPQVARAQGHEASVRRCCRCSSNMCRSAGVSWSRSAAHTPVWFGREAKPEARSGHWRDGPSGGAPTGQRTDPLPNSIRRPEHAESPILQPGSSSLLILRLWFVSSKSVLFMVLQDQIDGGCV